MRVAYLCRFAHQDIYRILGRDPMESPLSVLEQKLFEAALQNILQQEFEVPERSTSDDE